LVFLICGVSEQLPTFVFGLVVLGLFGGTMAAANAYLSSQIQQRSLLAQALNKTQFSARLAMITAPVILGSILSVFEPLQLYLWLSVLLLLSFVLTLSLPKDTIVPEHIAKREVTKSETTANSLWLVFLLQGLFAFSMVVTFPYFVLFAETAGISDPQWIGVLYALPHLIYLLLAPRIHRLPYSPVQVLAGGFLILTVAGLLHLVPRVTELVLARCLFGSGIVLCYHGLHQLLTGHLNAQRAGRAFSRFDAMSKWGGVVAGGCASWLSTLNNQALLSFVSVSHFAFPFLASALVSLGAFLLLMTRSKEWNRHDFHSMRT
jgi:hypothetical protein